MSLKDFKEEFRFICTDTWGYAMDAWFEAAGHLYNRMLDIPEEWRYRSAPAGNTTDEESYWYELFENATDEDLITIGNFLFRYCQYLKFKGVDY